MRLLALLSVAALAAVGCTRTSLKGTVALQTEADLQTYFQGFDASFVLHDLQRNEVVRFNPARARVRLSPCSTFKIPNALIGLETGVLSGADHAMTWDGTHYDLTAWNRDQTLRTAISSSVVWYF